MSRLKIFLVVCLILALVPKVDSQSLDDDFIQWNSTKYNLWKNSPNPPYTEGWEVLPFINVSQFLEPFTGVIWVQGNIFEGSIDYRLYNLGTQREILNVGFIPHNSQLVLLNENPSSGNKSLVLLATPVQVKLFECEKTVCQLKQNRSFDFGEQNKVVVANATQVYFGTAKGLFKMQINQNFSFSTITPFKIENESISDLAYNQKLNILAIGTTLRLWIYYEKFDYWRFEYCAVVIDNATTLTFRKTDDSLYIGSSFGVNILEWYYPINQTRPFYKIWRAGFGGGLPIGNLTFSASVKDRVFFAGYYGVATVQGQINDICPLNYTIKREWQGLGQIASTNTPWRYFYEQKWMTSGNVTALFVSSNEKVFVATLFGITILEYQKMKLQQKANIFQKIVEDRHNRFGYFSDISLKIPGSTSSFVQNPADSDSIWTNMYLASQCLRYNTTKDQNEKTQALTQINIAFQALQRLYKVTGIPGYMARTVIPLSNTTEKNWYNSTVEGFTNWSWKGDTSSDDVISFYFGIPIYIDLICDKNSTCIQEGLEMLVNTTDYIMQNNYFLLDITGQHTRWGVWNPDQLNGNESFYGERGENSLEILGILSTTYHYTKDEKYLNAIKNLGLENQYFWNAINFRMQQPDEINFSDDELGYFGLFAYLYHQESLPSELVAPIKKSLQRTYRIVRQYKPSLWILLTQWLAPEIVDQQAKNESTIELQQWNLDWITYRVNSTNRLDVVFSKYEGRNHDITPKTVDVIRKDERAANLKWNSNPYLLVDESNGSTEVVPTFYLLPYYVSKFLNSKIQNQYNSINQQTIYKE